MKSVAIFCGSQPGRQDSYRQAAEDLVDVLVDRGFSIVNALSTRLEVTVRRGDTVSAMSFKDGYKDEELHEIGTCGCRNIRTIVHSWPNASYFDSPRFSVP